MTRQLADSLNMKSLEEILAETETDDIDYQPEPEIDELPSVQTKGEQLMTTAQMKGLDHAEAMDEIYDEALDVARKIVDMGMNIDPTRAPRILEVANAWFKTAADAKISKRDGQLKMMKILQDQQKIDLETRKLNGELGKQDMIEGEVVFEGDRNKLLKILKAQKDAAKNPTE